MYIQFPERLNALSNSVNGWQRLSSRLAAWRQIFVQQHNQRKAGRLLAALDDRLLRDCAAAESYLHDACGLTSRDLGRHALNMQLLRLP